MVGCQRLLQRMVWAFVSPVCRLTHALHMSPVAITTSLLQAGTVIIMTAYRYPGIDVHPGCLHEPLITGKVDPWDGLTARWH